MDERQILAQLLMRGQGQGMGPGNPISEYYQGHANSKKGGAEALGTIAGLGLPLSALGWLTADPMEAAAMTALSGGAAYGGQTLANGAQEDRARSNMWANRFGQGQPAQGMPGTPGGPAWRR